MNISGILVHARPERRVAVTSELSTLDGVEVHHTTDDGRLVVTVEDCASREAAETLLDINRMAGILSASLVYHHFEPGPDGPGNEESGNEPNQA
jgi:nitrate reductase NapD